MIKQFLLLAILWCVTSAASTQELQVPVLQQGDDAQIKPEKGMFKVDVTQKFGVPITKVEAVGTPPIARWEYATFIVYFEYEHVVHAVAKHKPRSSDEVIKIPHDAPLHPDETR